MPFLFRSYKPGDLKQSERHTEDDLVTFTEEQVKDAKHNVQGELGREQSQEPLGGEHVNLGTC